MLPEESVGEESAAPGRGPWSPPSSPFQNTRQRRFTQSRLTLTGSQLTWSPIAARSGPGSQPFSVSIGTGVGQAAQLVWLCGTVVPSRSPGPQVNTVAVCAGQSSADRGSGRRVLGYLPIGLFAPFTGAGFDVHDSRAPTEQKIREVAQAAGLTYSAYPVEMGDKVNATFPGAVPNAGLIKGLGWFQAAFSLAFGIFVITWEASFRSPLAKVGLVVAGALMALSGLVVLPPVIRQIRKRRTTNPTRGE